MYAIIGSIGFSQKSNNARMDDAFKVIARKVNFFFDYCAKNHLVPVFLDGVFTNASNMSMLNAVYDEVFSHHIASKSLFVGDDFRVRLLSKLCSARTLSADEFNQTQKLIHIRADQSVASDSDYSCSVLCNRKQAGVYASASARGVIEFKLGRIYRENKSEDACPVGFVSVSNSDINEVRFVLEDEGVFVADAYVADFESSEFVERMVEFSSKDNEESGLEGVLSEACREKNLDDRVSGFVHELYLKSDLSI